MRSSPRCTTFWSVQLSTMRKPGPTAINRQPFCRSAKLTSHYLSRGKLKGTWPSLEDLFLRLFRLLATESESSQSLARGKARLLARSLTRREPVPKRDGVNNGFRKCSRSRIGRPTGSKRPCLRELSHQRQITEPVCRATTWNGLLMHFWR